MSVYRRRYSVVYIIDDRIAAIILYSKKESQLQS